MCNRNYRSKVRLFTCSLVREWDEKSVFMDMCLFDEGGMGKLPAVFPNPPTSSLWVVNDFSFEKNWMNYLF